MLAELRAEEVPSVLSVHNEEVEVEVEVEKEPLAFGGVPEKKSARKWRDKVTIFTGALGSKDMEDDYDMEGEGSSDDDGFEYEEDDLFDAGEFLARTETRRINVCLITNFNDCCRVSITDLLQLNDSSLRQSLPTVEMAQRLPTPGQRAARPRQAGRHHRSSEADRSGPEELHETCQKN